MAIVVVKHNKKTNAPVNPNVLVDGSTWDNDPHIVTGLDQVDNTSDVNKPVSTAQAAVIATVATNATNASNITSGTLASTRLPIGAPPANVTSVSYGLLTGAITVSSQPTYLFPEALSTEFEGDFSHVFTAESYTVNGDAMGQPATSFQWSPAVTPHQALVNYNSGFNNSTSSNDGRTGFGYRRTMINHNGQGDVVGNYQFCSINSTRAGATNFLATPACSVVAADLGATVSGCFLQGTGDFNFSDNGNDVAAIGDVRNFIRNNNTAALGEIWMGYRIQSSGTKPIDVGFSVTGPASAGLDTTQVSTPNMAAVNMASDQQIILNSTSTPIGGINWWGNTPGGSRIRHSSTNSQVEVLFGGNVAAGFTAAPSAVNYIQLLAESTGIAPFLVAKGSDANITMGYQAKGNGGHFFRNGSFPGPVSFCTVPTNSISDVNFLEASSNITGNAPSLSAQGSDANINLTLVPKGTGAVNFTNGTWTLTAPAVTDTLVGRQTTDTLINKNISGATNTLTNIPVSSLTGTTLPSSIVNSSLTSAAAAFTAGALATASDHVTVGGFVNVNGAIFTNEDRGYAATAQTSSAGASAGTLTNAPAAGNPTFWLKVNVNNTSFAIPMWPG